MTGRKRNDISTTVKWPGRRQAIEALKALGETEQWAGATLVSADLPQSGTVQNVSTARGAASFLMGLSASGRRASGYISGGDLTHVHSELNTAARDHLPLLVHHACGLVGTRTGALHDAFFATRDTGCFLFFGADAQEAIDLVLIGHRIAEQALVPGVCSQDIFSGLYDLYTLFSHEKGFVEEFLGRPDNMIPAPTASQRLLFGSERRRVPVLIDVNRPVGIGPTLDRTASGKALAGQAAYFSEHVSTIANEVFKQFKEDTGREYAAVSGYRADDAEYLVVAMGSVTTRLKHVVDDLRRQRKKAGLLTVRMYRPFPGSVLSHMIQGKKGITVLESVSGSFAEDLPLMADLRAAIDRATENGLQKNSPPPYPDYATLVSRSNRPALYSAISYSPGDASLNDLRAVFENMLPGNAGTRRYHLGVRFGAPSVRMPGLERLGQLLESAYKGLHLRGLKGIAQIGQPAQSQEAARLFGLSDHNMGFIGTLIAETLFRAAGGSVESRPNISSSGTMEGRVCDVFHNSNDGNEHAPTEEIDVVVAARSQMLTDAALLRKLRKGGSIVISTERTSNDLWNYLPALVRGVIQEKSLNVYLVAAKSITSNISSDRWIQSQLTAQVLAAGAVSRLGEMITSDIVSEEYRKVLTAGWTSGDRLLEMFLQAFDKGTAETRKIDWGPFVRRNDEPEIEFSAPWTAKEAPKHDDSVFDAGRFWNAVGYLYETGRQDDTLTDPYVASALLPARTAAFRSWSNLRHELPRFLPENCTACGSCFVSCPDAAMPVTAQTSAEYLDTAMNLAEKSGYSLLQLRRLQKHLATQAHRLIAGDDRHEYRFLGTLIEGSFERLVSRIELTEAEESHLRSELDHVVDGVHSFPIARTELLFKNTEQQEKGSGLLFSININAEACKACGICTTECAENALEMTPQTPELLEVYRNDWDFAMQLPVVSQNQIDKLVTSENPISACFRLLDRRAYHNVVGGDSTLPGSGLSATLHLLASIADAVMRPRAERFEEAVSKSIELLQNAIRNTIKHAVDINDFEEFSHRLSATGSEQLDPMDLSQIADASGTVDRKRLMQLNGVREELQLQLQKHQGSSTTGLRATMAAALSLASPDTNTAGYPYNPYSFPWINIPTGDVAAVAEGLFEGVASVAIEGIETLRKAKLILDDVYDPAEHDSLSKHSDLSDEEWGLCPPVCVFARSEEDVFPHLLNTSVPIKVFVMDSRFPVDAGQSRLQLWPLARPDMYLLRSTIGAPAHFLTGLQTGLATRRPSLFHLHICEPSTAGVLPNETIRSMRDAVESRAFPLLEYNPDLPGEWADRWDLSGNSSIKDDWTSRNIDRAITAGSSTNPTLFTVADWALQQGRFRKYFRHVPKSAWNSQMLRLIDFLALPAEERDQKEPFIEILTEARKVVRVRVLPEMVAATVTSQNTWRLLQELAGIRSSLVENISARIRNEFDSDASRVRDELTAHYEKMAETEKRSFESRMHLKLTEELLALSAYGPGTEKAQARLADLANNT